MLRVCPGPICPLCRMRPPGTLTWTQQLAEKVMTRPLPDAAADCSAGWVTAAEVSGSAVTGSAGTPAGAAAATGSAADASVAFIIHHLPEALPQHHAVYLHIFEQFLHCVRVCDQ